MLQDGATLAQRNRTLAALAAIVFCAGAIRAYGIGRESVWIDEGLSVRLAGLSLREILAATSEDGHPPLYLTLLHFWMRAFGTSEPAIRSLSAVLGTLAVAALYALGACCFDRRTGLVGALLLAFSPYHIYYSQEARNYALLALLSVLSHLGLARLRTRPDTASRALYVVSTILMLYTHVFGFFVWAAQNLYLIAVPDEGGLRKRSWVLLQGAIVASLIPWAWGPWAARLWLQGQPATTRLQLTRPSLFTVLAAFVGYSGSLPGFVLTAPWVAVESVLALRSRRRTGTAAGAGGRIALLLLSGMVVPHLLPFVYSQILAPIYIARPTIVALPPFLLLAARGLRRRGTIVEVVAVCGITISALLAQLHYSRLVSKEQWRDVAQAVDDMARPHDLVVFDAGYGAEGFNYYSRRHDLRQERLTSDVGTEAGLRELRAVRGDAIRIWLVRFQRPRDDAAAARALTDGYGLAGSGRYAGIDLYLFERRGAPPR